MLPHPSGPPICVAIPLARHKEKAPPKRGQYDLNTQPRLMGYASASNLGGQPSAVCTGLTTGSNQE
jgi:hypothetical protein